MDWKKVGTHLSADKEKLFSSIILVLLGVIGTTLKEKWPLLLKEVSLPIWGVGTIFLGSVGVMGLFFSKKEEVSSQTKQALQARLDALEKTRADVDERDWLTDLYNLRKFESFIKNDLPGLVEGRKDVWAALLDINQFKNKTSGSSILIASEVLRQLGKRWRSRDSKDIILRWGGDEFMVICPDSDMEEITGFVKRLQEKASEKPFIVSGAEKAIEISVAAGITQWHEDDDKWKFQTRLGKALQAAKDRYVSLPSKMEEKEKYTTEIR